MSLAMLFRKKLGGFAYFAEQGKVIDSVTVGPTTAGKPDTDPVTNWPAIGEVLSVQPGFGADEEQFDTPRVGGGYSRETVRSVTIDFLDIRTKEVSEPFWRLMFGLPTEITSGVAQSPFTFAEREMFGWLKLQLQDQAGQNVAIIDMWTKLSFLNLPEFVNRSATPTFRFERVPPTSGESVVVNDV